MLNHRSVILLKVETTYNTDPTPATSANELLVENLNWSFSDARMTDRMPVRASKGVLKPLYGGTLMQITFDVEMKGSGAAGTAPEVGAALQACGCSETISAGVSVTYKPASSSLKSCTIYLYRDGKLIKATGCVGQVSASLAVGAYGKMSFTFIGHFVSETDVTLATPSYDSTVPPILVNLSSFTVDSATFALTKLDFDLGNEVARPADIVGADGYGTVQITGRRVTGGIDPEDVLVATYDWVTKWQSGAAVVLSTGTIGATAGNKYAISFPAATYTEEAPGDKSGIVTRDIKFHAAESSSDDEISIVYT